MFSFGRQFNGVDDHRKRSNDTQHDKNLSNVMRIYLVVVSDLKFVDFLGHGSKVVGFLGFSKSRDIVPGIILNGVFLCYLHHKFKLLPLDVQFYLLEELTNSYSV